MTCHLKRETDSIGKFSMGAHVISALIWLSINVGALMSFLLVEKDFMAVGSVAVMSTQLSLDVMQRKTFHHSASWQSSRRRVGIYPQRLSCVVGKFFTVAYFCWCFIHATLFWKSFQQVCNSLHWPAHFACATCPVFVQARERSTENRFLWGFDVVLHRSS